MSTSLPCCVAAAMIAAVTMSPALGQTGTDVPSLAAYDQFMRSFLTKWQIPGGALAISRNGQLLYARGFGVADRESGEPVKPDSLFRIASDSKPVTAVAVMKLVQEGRLNLDAPVFDLLPEYLPDPRPASFDARITGITIRQLLHHTAGWDREALGFDPMDRVVDAARIMGEPSPGGCPTVIRAMLRTFPLDFAPGQRFAYSNLGYCLLGRVIEKVTGNSYEQYLREELLRPAGIEQMKLGRSRLEDRLPGEVKYYDNGSNVPSVFPNGPSTVPRPYGGFHIEAMDAHGGLLASAVELAKFADSVYGRRGEGILTRAIATEMIVRPPAPVSQTGGIWYGKGWTIISTGGARDRWEHDGGLPGTMAFLVRAANGFIRAVLFNSRPPQEAYAEISAGLWQTFQTVSNWPSHDLYPEFAAAGSRPRLAASMAVTNAASAEPGIVAGSWVTIRGSNLSGSQRTWQASDWGRGTLPVLLDGVQVLMNGKPSAIQYISETQLNAQAPDLSPGPIWVRVVRDGEYSEPVQAELRNSAPALFMYGSGGKRWASAIHSDGTLVGNPTVTPGSRATTPGGRVSLYATGLLPSPAGNLIPASIPISEPVEVRVGDAPATVEYVGLVGPGLFQINIVVPESLAPGDLEVTVKLNGEASQAGVLLPLAR